MKNRYKILFFFALLFSCCITRNNTKEFVNYDKTLRLDECYVYGKFFMINKRDSDNKEFVSIGLVNEKNNEIHKIFFLNKEYIFAIKIPPGDYCLKYIIYGENKKIINKNKRTGKELYKFSIDNGEAVYIGDFYANCYKESKEYEESYYTTTSYLTEYWLEKFLDNFDSTTKNLKLLYEYEYDKSLIFRTIFTKTIY